MKKWIITITILLVIGTSLGAIAYFSTRTLWNNENIPGNSAGNLANGGFFCEDGDTIYFANPKDSGSLYSMSQDCTNFKKLHEDRVSSINAASHYIVYVRENHERNKSEGSLFSFNNVGIYRINKKDGSNIKQLYDDPAGITSLFGNYIYYQHYNTETNLEFYKVKLDGSEEARISTEPIVPASMENGHLYYNGIDNDHNIHALNLSNDQNSDVAYGNYFSVLAQGGFLFYLDLENHYSIGRMGMDGSYPELLVRERCSFFNVSPDNRYLYYQIDGTDHNQLCRMDLLTLEQKTILEGDFCRLHTTSKYLFFQDFHTEQWYQYDPAGDSLNSFSPPVL